MNTHNPRLSPLDVDSPLPARTRRRNACLTLAAAVAIAAPDGRAFADIVEAIWAPDFCRYRVTDMPDIDQRRLGLAAEGGMHCVPTASYNLFAYATHHGYPFLLPGALPYQSDSVHGFVTSDLEAMGGMMSTDGTNGTTLNGWKTGFGQWNIHAGAPLGGPQFVFQFRIDADCTFANISKSAVLGGLVSFCFGRYDVTGVSGNLPVVARDGGHLVTVARMERDPMSARIWVRDPATDEGGDGPLPLAKQSEFSSRELPIGFMEFANLPGFRTFIVADDDRFRILDAYVAMWPAVGFTWESSEQEVWRVTPISLPSFGGIAQGISFGTDVTEVVQVVHDAAGLDAFAIVRLNDGSTKLQRLDFAQRAIATIEDPAITGELSRIAVGRFGEVYIHNGETIFRISPRGVMEGSTAAVIKPDAISYDDATDQLVVLSPSTRTITRLDRALGIRAQVPVPSTMPLDEDSTLCVGTDDGAVYFGNPNDDRVGRLDARGTPDDFSIVSVPGLGSVRSLSAGDGNRLYVTNGKELRVLVKPPTGGPWTFDTQSSFDGRAVSTGFEMMRSRTNYDPALHSGPEWRNIRVDALDEIGIEVPDCNADLNGDDAVDSVDLALLLSNWGGTTITYDVDKDGVTGPADLSLLLSSWGGCP